MPMLAAETVRVAAAISMKEAVTDIAKAYEAETGDKVTLTFGSSGQLAAQLKAGAPIDVFISAATAQLDDLDKAGLVDAATRRDVAGNSIVLIVPADGKVPLADFAALADAGIKRLAIGEPKTVPAGQYAQQTLNKLGLSQRLAGRLIFGANVRQVLSYVERGEVSAGIVYATDARESGAKVRVIATADPATHDPIRYPAAVTKTSKSPVAAKRFLDSFGGEKAKAVLAAKGFTLPNADKAEKK